MTARSTMELVLDEFLAAVAAAGGPAPEEPISQEDLAAVEEAIAPLRLPSHLVATWRRFQTGETTVLTWMPMQRAALGLEMWRDEFLGPIGAGPRLLFPLAYESHSFVLVELATETTPGGTLFDWAYDGGPARPVFPDLASAFACATQGWRRGVLGTWEESARDEWGRLSQSYARAAEYPEHLAPFEAIDLARPLSWPSVWREACGIDAAAAEPRGSTTNVHALRTGRSGAGTVVGRIANLAGTGAGSRIVLDDGTGELVIWSPAAADPFTAVVAGEKVELDVVCMPETDQRPAATFDVLAGAIQTSALAGDLAAAQALALELVQFFDPSATDALATAARPLGDETRYGRTRLRDGYRSTS